MDDKKTVESLEEVFAAGEAWLRKYGMVTSIAHNAIVTNLYVNFPKVHYLEYFLPEDVSRRKVWVILYVPFWKLLFTNRDRLADDVIAFLREYLDGYDIRVELKRYKKGVEKSNEVPKDASNHLADAASGNPDVGARADESSAEAAPTEPVGGPGNAPGDDPAKPQAAPAEHADGPKVPPGSDPGESQPPV